MRMLSVMNFDAFKETENAVDKKKIEIATNFLDEARLTQVFEASALDVESTDTSDRSVAT